MPPYMCGVKHLSRYLKMALCSYLPIANTSLNNYFNKNSQKSKNKSQ